MGFRYSPIKRWLKIIYRKFKPVPTSPWTKGKVDDICKINLVPPETLKEFFAKCIHILQKRREKGVGNYLEFGVFNGSSIGSAYLTARKMNVPMKFFGFDAFQGLPPGSEKEDDGVWEEGFYECSFDKMKQCLKRRGVDPNHIKWIKGWYNNTLNEKTIKKFGIKKPGIVFIDCDTYSSSKAVLKFIGPLIKEDIIICFDDWKLNDLDVKGMGEYRSFNEFLEQNTHLTAQEIRSYNRKSKTFIVRPASHKQNLPNML